jgi:predicted transposase/invertase (TIGR01784 family)
MPSIPELTREFSGLPPPSPLDNFMFAANFQSMKSAPSAMSLVNSVLRNAGRLPLEAIDMLNCEQVLLGEGRKLRGCRLDLEIRDGDHRLNVEVQVSSLQHMADRMVFNSSRMLSLNTPSGTDYGNLPKITVISIIDFIYRKNHQDFHQPYGLLYEKNPERVTDKFDYHMLEMPKFRKLKPDFSIPVQRWLFYMDYGYKDPESPIVKEVLQMDQGLYDFARQYQRNASDPKTLYAYYGHIMERMDEQSRIKAAVVEGEARGEARRNAEIAKNALRKQMPVADIMDITGLSQAEIEALAAGL